MSYWYTYYIGYELNGVVHVAGPHYKESQKAMPALAKSQSFASDLYDDFYALPENKMGDDVKYQFTYTDWDGKETLEYVKYLPIEQLPSVNFVKMGYYLIQDIQRYQKYKVAEQEYFYNMISPEVYLAKVENQMKFGPNPEKEDVEGGKYKEPDASEYMFYAIPDYNSREYESFFLKQVVDMVDYAIPYGAKVLILETEG